MTVVACRVTCLPPFTSSRASSSSPACRARSWQSLRAGSSARTSRPGATVVREGDPGERFYIVLSGMLTVTQAGVGERRMLRPGDSFGEVALAMGIPRTASVRAVTPAVVASCDSATFDEILRPLFADE